MPVASPSKQKILNKKIKAPRAGPLWQGPEAAGPHGGITQSMIASWLVCRERFRLKYVEGLRPLDDFNHRVEYGNMWHACEERFAARPDDMSWQSALQQYCQGLIKRYPLRGEQVEHWFGVCAAQFPVYVEHWAKHPDEVKRTPLLQEQVFDVPYKLPSGRAVRLRGKWDSVDLIGEGKGAGVYLGEHKTKGDVDRQLIEKQLTRDLQTMVYLVALEEQRRWELSDSGGLGQAAEKLKRWPILGVRYNVVRRPCSGKGPREQKQPSKSNPRGETKQEFYGRIASCIKEDPGDWFMRFRCEVSVSDVRRFRDESLDPILEQICDWYTWQFPQCGGGIPGQSTAYSNFVMPYGVYSPLLDGGQTEYDHFLATGSEAGLTRSDELFAELKGGA